MAACRPEPMAARLALVLLLTALGGCAPIQQRLYDGAVASRRADAGLVERRATVRGRAVSYLERPGAPGGRTVVLVHGFAGSKDHWLALAPLLPADARLIVPDLAGHGGSAAVAAPDAPVFAADLAALLDSLRAAPADLVGNSLGGLVATLVALDAPARVRSLTLLDPAGLRSPTPSRTDTLLAAGQAVLIPTTRAAYDRLVEMAFSTPPELPGLARAVLLRDVRRREPYLRALLAALVAQPDRLAGRLGALDAPTLLLWGADDQILHPSAADRWSAERPGLAVEILGGVGHAPMMEVPETVADRLTAFWGVAP
jgi:pimeloyl-ACP methyl ester carboxylesterase